MPKVRKINEPETDVTAPDRPTKRQFACSVRTVPGRDRVLRFTASTEEVARDGDIVRVAGWDIEKFMANPVFLWAHSYDELPVGRVVKVKKVRRAKAAGGPRLEIDVEFAGLDQLHEKAETVYLLYRDGFLRAVSVGFLPHEYEDIDSKAKEKLGLGEWGRVVSRAELLEVSAVPVPADSGALLIPDEEDRAAVREQFACVRSMAAPDQRAAWDALSASLDDEPEPDDDEPEERAAEPDPEPAPDITTILTEFRALREFVEARLAVPDLDPEADDATPPDPADEPEDAAIRDAAPTPPANDEPKAAPADPYGFLEAVLDRINQP